MKFLAKFVVSISAAAALSILLAARAYAVDGTSRTQVYVVTWGDTLGGIARQFDVTVEAIVEANDLIMPDHLYAGQLLIIPHPRTNPLQAEPGQEGLPSVRVHTVQRGETLYRISLHYGVPIAAIVAANNLINPSRIYVGQQLIIPANGPDSLTTLTESTPLQHIVQRGETLAIIAHRYGVPMSTLVQANNLSNPSLLYIGQVLMVPSVTAPGTGGPSANLSSTVSYVIQRGDTLGGIAQRFGVAVRDLISLNQITNANQIYVGQTLIIPSGSDGDTTILPAEQPSLDQVPTPTVTEGKQIVVVLSQQRTYAFEDGQLVGEFVVSTGLPDTPTVTGEYRVYLKLASDHMVGPGYDLPGVPWVMYFFQGYGLHGTYWHNNFGQPMSHGCVNMRTPDAEWLFNWATLGTSVLVIN